MSIPHNTPLTLLGGITAEEFLRDYWQKKPLLIRQAMPDFVSPIEGDELAGLALEDEVESRIVLEHGETPWQLLHGPFTEDTFAKLPPSHWTLLVQAVDQFVPDAANYWKEFDFLPRWRSDDLMISYAVEGGGVGPHYDNYDVFLLQAEGRREWKVGQMCDSDSPLQDHPDMRILAEFNTTESWILEPGDMLYLPPRLAHWGTALDNCMTWSFGYRAPSTTDALLGYTDFVARFLTDEQRYNDAGMSPITNPNEIRAEELQRLRALINEQLSDDQTLLAWLGQFVTEAKYPDFIQGHDITEHELLDQLQQGSLLIKHPSARFAWSLLETNGLQEIVLFSCGNSRIFNEPLVELIKLICDSDSLHADNLQPWLNNGEATLLLCELIKQGSLECIND